MSRVIPGLLDEAAARIATALGVKVSRDPIGAEAAEDELAGDTALIVALSEGFAEEHGFLMGAATPFELTHHAALELVAVKGSETERKGRVEAALVLAAGAIAADPRLGGICDFAELVEPDPSVAERFAACAAQLDILYSAPSALG